MREVWMLAMPAALALATACEEQKAAPAKALVAVRPLRAPVGTRPTTPAVAGTPALAAGGGGLKGTVLEKLDAATYSYLRLQTAQGETWAAVPQTATPVGAEVEVVGGPTLDGFQSKTLGRTFDKIIFGNLGGTGPGATPEQVAAAAAAIGTPPMLLGAPSAPGPAPAAKASPAAPDRTATP